MSGRLARWSLTLCLVGCGSSTAAPVAAPRSLTPPTVTHGGAVGEVDSESAVVWSRCNDRGHLHVVVKQPRSGHELVARGAVDATNDFTGRVRITGLAPGTEYVVSAWCSRDGANLDGDRDRWRGRFRTAPPVASASAVRFAWGGDISGQNVCRDRRLGFPIFSRIRDIRPDFFVALGDMIYADDPCLAVGRYGNAQHPGPPPARDIDGFRAVWRYNRMDREQQALLDEVPIYSVLDDHEVINDAGPQHDTAPSAPWQHLLPTAVVAFLEYQPLALDGGMPPRLYRSARWGKHLELFFLDTRQHRDSNLARDDPEAPKTMLGKAQRDWLIAGLTRSDATWKVVVSSVPISIPTGTAGRDGWANYDQATGFETELRTILDAARRAPGRNLLWITTDVHFGAAFRYQPFASDDDFSFHEIVTGPLNAGVFPKPQVDESFHPERLLLYGPPSDRAIADFDEAQRWFSFGTAEIDRAGNLRLAVINGRGETVFERRLQPGR